MNNDLSSLEYNYIQNTQQCQEHACMSADDWKHGNYKSFVIGKCFKTHWKDVQIRLQIRQCFVGKPLPAFTLKRSCVLHVTSNKEKNCNWYVLISFFKEVQGNASWNEQKKSGDAYRQSDKRIEFIVISVLLYPRQVHKCTGVCTIDTAKNKWIPSI